MTVLSAGAHASEERILEFCDRVFSGASFRPNPTAAAIPMEVARTEHAAAVGGIQEGLFPDFASAAQQEAGLV